MPQFKIDGEAVSLDVKTSFSLTGNIKTTLDEVSKLELTKICSGLEGAYVNVIPTENKNSYFITVMPIIPNTETGGKITFKGKQITIEKTKSLAIYKIDKRKVAKVY